MNESYPESTFLKQSANDMLRGTCLTKIALAAGEGDAIAHRALNMADPARTEADTTAIRELPCALGKCGIRLEAAAQGALVTPVDCVSYHQSL